MPKIAVVGIPGAWSTRMLARAVHEATGSAPVVDMNAVVADLESGDVTHEGLNLCDLDAVAVKKIGSPYSPDLLDRLTLLEYVQARGTRVFSDPGRIKKLLDRLGCTAALRAGGIPMPPTVVTESIDHAVDAVHRFGRSVLKPLYTSKARGMKLIEPGPDLREQVQAFQADGNTTIYVQKMLHLGGQDLGITFLGGRPLGCYARVGADSSWNTTTRSGGRYEPFDPEPEIIELAGRAQELFQLDFTSVDVAITDDGPVVFEVSAFGGFRGLWEACGINAAEQYVQHILKLLK